MSDQKPVAWIRQRDNVLALNDGGVFGSDWTPLYYAALAQPEQEPEPEPFNPEWDREFLREHKAEAHEKAHGIGDK